MSAGSTAYLLLGSNLGDRAAHLRGAIAALAATAGTVLTQSAHYKTAAWGREDQPAFLNQALALRTSLTPTELLARCLAAEQAAGRVRRAHWGSRTLDVDILLIDTVLIASPTLTVPHPRLPERRFALAPLAEIAGDVLHPALGLTVRELLARCPDPLAVLRVD